MIGSLSRWFVAFARHLHDRILMSHFQKCIHITYLTFLDRPASQLKFIVMIKSDATGFKSNFASRIRASAAIHMEK